MLVITPGEPAGIGPELLVRLAQSEREHDWVVVADPDLLRARAAAQNLPLSLHENTDRPVRRAGSLTLIPHHLARPSTPGALDSENADYVLATLVSAVDWCLAGTDCALVTGPVQKSLLDRAAQPFSGHTEFLRDRCGVDDVVMLLVAGQLRVALATTHLPLRAVPDAITEDLLLRRLTLLHDGLVARFGIREPRILVAGLNPHAGEDGHLGREEIETIAPVCARLRAAGWVVQGPLPADTLFTQERLRAADAAFAMYHDQGLPVLKHAGFGQAVNVTLGLPFLRTSVDHGTALDIAGTGRADVGSFAAAIKLAQGACGLPRADA